MDKTRLLLKHRLGLTMPKPSGSFQEQAHWFVDRSHYTALTKGGAFIWWTRDVEATWRHPEPAWGVPVA